MNLRAISDSRRARRGFTLIELLIVLSITVILAVAAVPIYSGMMPAGDSTQVASEIVQTLRIARARSVARLGNSPFGVKFLPAQNQYALYHGASYVPGNVERAITLGKVFSLNAAPSDDINFTMGNGATTAGTITLRHQTAQTKTITINQFGMVEIQ
jgi:type IV fimbrial biogenesis protein FimT